jgi:hypothetical protein
LRLASRWTPTPRCGSSPKNGSRRRARAALLRSRAHRSFDLTHHIALVAFSARAKIARNGSWPRILNREDEQY